MSDRRNLIRRLAPAFLLVLIGAVLIARLELDLSLPNADTSAVDQLTDALDSLPEEPLVLVGFDPDIGTYAEVRPTVRSLLADLLNRGATLAFVSLTPEGRALELAELRRMDRGEANPRQIVDLGFVPGAEAALVALAREIGGGTSDPISTEPRTDEDLGTVDLALIVGGIDLGPRTWVEQLSPRIEDLPLVAVAPTVLLPELEPYRESGQLAALLGTPRDGAAYRAGADLGRLERLVDPQAGPSPAAILTGLLVAIAVLGEAVVRRLAGIARAVRPREAT